MKIKYYEPFQKLNNPRFNIILHKIIWEYLTTNFFPLSKIAYKNMLQDNIITEDEYLYLILCKNYNLACQYAVDKCKNHYHTTFCNYCPFKNNLGEMKECKIKLFKEYNDLVKIYSKLKSKINILLNGPSNIEPKTKIWRICEKLTKIAQEIKNLPRRPGIKIYHCRSNFKKHEWEIT